MCWRRVGRRDSERVGPQDWLGRECGEPIVCEARNRSLHAGPGWPLGSPSFLVTPRVGSSISGPCLTFGS